MTNPEKTARKLQSLVLFRGLQNDPVLILLIALLERPSAPAYAEFTAALFARDPDFSRYVRQTVLDADNLYLQKTLRGDPIPAPFEPCLREELALLQSVSQVESARVKALFPQDTFLPDWQTSPVALEQDYRAFLANARQTGWGDFAKYHMFFAEGTRIVPAAAPDPVRLSDLSGYQPERGEVIRNTRALLAGRPAANVLLYGDSGTGKSSTVKAIANEFFAEGLRLVEVKKSQLSCIPALIEALSQNPLKFILFIDDLSFMGEDDNFSALKAALEGSVLARTPNIAIYATSNRRHLVRETFSDRAGDDIHRNETIQQLVSLSDRFGLTVAFVVPSRAEYLEIVAHIAKLYEVAMPRDELFRQAEVYALHKGGRSPRVARQFVEQLAAMAES